MEVSQLPHDESRVWAEGDLEVHYYDDELEASRSHQEVEPTRKTVIQPKDMPWEHARHGRIKHLVHERMNTRLKTVDAYIQEIPPGGRSGKHQHMAEEILYVLEGRGYDLHWDVDVEIEDQFVWKVADEACRYAWEEGDLVYIPINTVHQHVNADPDRPARFISAVNRMYRYIGYRDLRQWEDAEGGSK